MAAESSGDAVGTVLSEAVDDAQLLLSHAARRGLAIDRDTVRTIVGAKPLARGDPSRPEHGEQEVAFWRALDLLAAAVSPVTVASLRATTQLRDDHSLFGLAASRITGQRRQVTAAALAVRRVKRWAIFSLACVLLLQIYWLIGSTVAGNLPRLLREVQQLQEQAGKRENLLKEQGKTAALDLQLQVLDAKRDNYEARIAVNYGILAQWLNILHLPGYRHGADAPAAEEQQFVRLSKALATAQFVLLAVQTYLLPLLYGLLGAVTYVLRSMAQEIKALTYTREAEIRYRLRMIMGGLAGLVVAWFIAPAFQDAGAPILESLSPFALAFLAGYSVELLFAALDRIVAAFSGEEFGKRAR